MIKCNMNVLVSTNTVYLQFTIHVKIVHAVHTLSCLNLSFIYKQCLVLTQPMYNFIEIVLIMTLLCCFIIIEMQLT